MRVLKWIFERERNWVGAAETPLGLSPTFQDLDWCGLEKFGENKFNSLMALAEHEWQNELKLQSEFFDKFKDRLPRSFMAVHEELTKRLKRAFEKNGELH
jgi:phosphoenolpyruvate carboxykinase (GTP)